jgi:hypothetical protein
MDEHIKELGEAIYRDKVRRARLQPPEEKMRDGPRLFDYACEIVKAGIRAQFPDASEERVLEILKERIARQRRLENRR